MKIFTIDFSLVCVCPRHTLKWGKQVHAQTCIHTYTTSTDVRYSISLIVLLLLFPDCIDIWHCVQQQDAFIGFGGNVVREKVKEGAAWYIYTMQDLIDELEQNSKETRTELEAVSKAIKVFFGCDASRRGDLEAVN